MPASGSAPLGEPFEVWSTRLFPKGKGADGYQLTGLAARCDWVVLSDFVEPLTCLRESPGAPASPRTVFLSLRRAEPAFEYFTSQVLPRINTPFVLFSGSEDVTTPRQTDLRWPAYPPPVQAAIAEILAHPLLAAWWTENLDDAVHPKLRPMPLGLLPSDGRSPMADPAEFEPLDRRPLTVLCAHRHREGPQWAPRRQVSEIAAASWADWTTLLGDEVDEPAFMRLLLRHAFVLCVEGGGLDPSPKAWLCLLHGAIPIIRRSPTTTAYEGLPVVIIEDWRSDLVTHAELENWRTQLSGRFQQVTDWRRDWFHRLSIGYWWGRLVEPLGETASAVRFSAVAVPRGPRGPNSSE
jgi:hypothetical protein